MSEFGEGVETEEEARAIIIKALSDIQKDRMKILSLLHEGEPDQLALMQTIGERYDLKWVSDFITNILRMRVSLEGFRSIQLVKVATAKVRELEESEGRVKGFLRRIGLG